MPGLPDAVSELEKIFTDTANSALGAGYQLLTDRENFLKTDLPANASATAKWIQEANRRGCRAAARQPRDAMNAYSRAVFDSTCVPYLTSIGEGPSSGSISQPFTGGQCTGKPYVIKYRSRTYDAQGNLLSDQQYNDTYPTSYSISYGPLGWQDRCFSDYGRSSRITGFTSFFSNGSPANGPATTMPGGCDYGHYTIFSDINIISLQGADNCGNLDPIYKPPSYPSLPTLPPPTTPAPNTNTNDWDIKVGPNGDIQICINGICGNPFSPGGGKPDQKGKPDGPPQSTDPNGDASGSCTDGYLVGLKINFVPPIPQDARTFGPDIYRGVCWIWMGPAADRLDLVPDGANLKDGQFVYADSNQATHWRVKANGGWKLTIQQYCRPKKKDE